MPKFSLAVRCSFTLYCLTLEQRGAGCGGDGGWRGARQRAGELLGEVAALVEAPTVLAGSFDAAFLALPRRAAPRPCLCPLQA